MIPTLHEKHKKMCSIRSTGSTKLTFVTPLQRNYHFFFGSFTAEGCQKWKIVLPMLHEKHKKSMRFTEHEKHIFHFYNPSRRILTVLQEFSRLAWTRVDSRAEMGVRLAHLTLPYTRRSQDDVSYIKLPQISNVGVGFIIRNSKFYMYVRA